MIVKPAVAKFKYNLDSGDETSRILATSPGHELVSVLATAGAQPIAVRIYDSATASGNSKDSILIAANAGESSPYTPSQPVPMIRGIYVVIEQGSPSGEVFLTWN